MSVSYLDFVLNTNDLSITLELSKHVPATNTLTGSNIGSIYFSLYKFHNSLGLLLLELDLILILILSSPLPVKLIISNTLSLIISWLSNGISTLEIW